MSRRFIATLSCLVALLFAASAADAASMLKLSSLAQKKQHHELIRLIRQDLEQQAPVSSFELYLLAGAYYEVRDYRNLGAAIDLFETRLGAGDVSFYGGDLRPYPSILRANIALDEGNWQGAIDATSRLFAQLEGSSNAQNPFRDEQFIAVTGVLGVAWAHLNRNDLANDYAEALEALGTRTTILGPEKFIAIARIRMAQREYGKALAAVQDPSAKVSGLTRAFYDETFQELPKYFILTKAQFETGRLAEARKGYDQLLKHPQIQQVGGLYWPILLDRARIARSDGDDALAEKLLREAAEVIERQRASIGTESGRIGYVGDKQDVYGELVALFVRQARSGEAFEYVERAKGRALVDLLSSAKDIAIRDPHPEQAAQLFQTLAGAEQDLSVLPESAKVPAARRGLALELKRDLAAKAPMFTSLVSVEDTPLRDLQNRIGDDETLLEYYATGSNWYVFVVTPQQVAAVALGTPAIADEVRRFRETLMDPGADDYLEGSRRLYDALFAPIAATVTTRGLIVVPHGPLHYLPFAALADPSGVPMVDRFTLRVLQSASVLKFLSPPAQAGGEMLVIGNPDLGDARYSLAFAEREARDIAQAAPGSLLLLRDQAKAAFVRANAGRYRILHFAAHALFDAGEPLQSALLLAASPGDDGRLRAADLYHLALNADLVVLSACETGLGQITAGDDVVGFTRGLLYAGARTIVSTLWQVDDQATRDLMVDFYARLGTMGASDALRQAQLEVRRQYRHPYYWASFQLTGLGG